MMFRFKIEDVAEIVAGGTPPTAVRSYWNGGIPWITPRDMSELKTKYVSSTATTISEDGLAHSAARLFPPHSIILSTRAPVGYLAINDVAMTSNQGIKAIVCNETKVSPEFLYYYLKTKVADLERASSGSTFKELPTSGLRQFEIEIPSLSVQLRIAGLHGTNLSFASCAAISASRAAPRALRSARFFCASARRAWNSSSVMSMCSILISKYCPAERE